MTWFLIDAAGYRYPLGEQGLSLGRAAESDIVLTDDEASRQHAVVRLEGADAWLEDLKSFNGVFVNSVRLLKPQRLRHGDAIRLGRTQLRAEWTDSPQIAPQSAPAPSRAAQPSGLPSIWPAVLGGAAVGLIALSVIFVLFLRPLLTGATANSAATQNRYDVYVNAINSVAFVLAPIGETTRANAGTAVVLSDKGRLLTAYSVVYDPNTGRPYNSKDQVLIGLRGDGQYTGKTLNRWYLARVVRADRQRDLAVLQIFAQEDGSPLPNSFQLDAVPLGSSRGLDVGDDLAVISFPAGLEQSSEEIGRALTIGEGQVTGFLPDSGLGIENGWIQSNIGLSLGNLGGIVLDRRGELIGLYSGASPSGVTGPASLLRPIELADPLLAGAR